MVPFDHEGHDCLRNGREDFTFCVCTFNSGKTLEKCLRSVRIVCPEAKLIVVDHYSSDDSLRIARQFNAKIIQESKGLGYARQLCFDNTHTTYLVFVDSDVEIVKNDFMNLAMRSLADNYCGAVVGMALGHRFQYGLPAGLLVLRKRDFEGEIVPDFIDARETFFIERRLQDRRLKIFYANDSMIHRSEFRSFKPEWEGANTRLLPASPLTQLVLALQTIILLSLNSRNLKNIAYVPLFYLKFLRGFANPIPWMRLERGGTRAV